MSHRLITLTFWVGIATSSMALLMPHILAAPKTDDTTSLRGIAIGYFNYASVNAQPAGLAMYTLDQEANRRVQGTLAVLLEGSTLYNAINITQARADFYVGTGGGDLGHMVLRGDPMFFEGGAMFSTVDYQVKPLRGRPVAAQTFTLRAFEDSTDPPEVGIWEGTIQSHSPQGFSGLMVLSMDSPDELIHPSLSFQGSLTLAEPRRGGRKFLFSHVGTVHAGDGRFVMIAQGAAGRLASEGVFYDADGRTAFANARYQLSLLDGRVDYGAYNFEYVFFPEID